LVLLFARSIDGITWWNSSVANAYITDITQPQERSKIFWYTGAVIGLSLILGPAVGGWVSSVWWYSEVLYVAIGISMVALVWLWWLLEESLDAQDRKQWSIERIHELNVIEKFSILQNHSSLKPYFRLYGVFGFVFAAFTSNNVLYATDILGFDEWTIGLLYFGIGLSLMFHQLVTVRRATSKYEDKQVFLVGLWVLSISLLPYFLEPWIILFCVISFFVPAGIALALATFKWLITNEVQKKEYWAITWLDESLLAWNRSLAPVLMGYWFWILWGFAFGMLWVVLWVSVFRYFLRK
jgi:DHA1 family tetracycline resistance protein-like MFS transporter